MTHFSAVVPSSVPRVTESLAGWLLCAGIVVSTLVYSFAFTSFLVAKDAVLCIFVIAIACFMVFGATKKGIAPLQFTPLWLLLIVAATYHLFWKPVPLHPDAGVALARWATLLLVAGWVMQLAQFERWRRRLCTALMVAGVCAAVLGLAQYAGLLPWLFPTFVGYPQPMYSVFGNQDLLGGYLALVVPLLLYHALKPEHPSNFAMAALVPVIPALLLTGARSAWLAACVGALFALPWAHLRSRRMATLAAGVCGLAAMCVLLAPDTTWGRMALTFSRDDHGAYLRLWFWAAALRMVAHAPWFGLGPGQFQYYSPTFQGDVLHGENGAKFEHNEVHTLHAHSDPLEFVAEFGLVGICFVAWFGVMLARTRGPEWAGLAALLVYSLLNFPFHVISHSLAGIVLAAILFARKTVPSPPATFARLSHSTAAIATSIYLLLMFVIPSYALQTSRDTPFIAPASVLAFAPAAQDEWSSYQAHLDWGMKLLHSGQHAEARATLLIAQQGVDTGDVHLALGIAEARLGNEDEAAAHLDACLYRWPSSPAAWRWRLSVASEHEREELIARAARWLSPEDLERLDAQRPGA